jgi:hypothetical protein
MDHKTKVREITGRKNLHAVKAFIARAEEELRNGQGVSDGRRNESS